MPTRAYVQVAADGVGKKVANVSNTDPTAPDSSGNATADTVTYQQLVTPADSRGDVVGDRTDELLAVLHLIQEELVLLRLQLS